jgi:ribulose-5-phosphate 4-epimerase/fuculose-1-phosphate aldolase
LPVFIHSSKSAKDDLYFLEQAARIQVLAMQTNLPLVLVDEEVCKLTKNLGRRMVPTVEVRPRP